MKRRLCSSLLPAYSFADRKGRIGRHSLLFCSEYDSTVGSEIIWSREGGRRYSFADRKGRGRRGLLSFYSENASGFAQKLFRSGERKRWKRSLPAAMLQAGGALEDGLFFSHGTIAPYARELFRRSPLCFARYGCVF